MHYRRTLPPGACSRLNLKITSRPDHAGRIEPSRRQTARIKRPAASAGSSRDTPSQQRHYSPVCGAEFVPEEAESHLRADDQAPRMKRRLVRL